MATRKLADHDISGVTYNVESIEDTLEHCYSKNCMNEGNKRYMLENEYQGVFCCRACAMDYLATKFIIVFPPIVQDEKFFAGTDSQGYWIWSNNRQDAQEFPSFDDAMSFARTHKMHSARIQYA